MATAKKKTGKKRVKRNIPEGIAFIHTTLIILLLRLLIQVVMLLLGHQLVLKVLKALENRPLLRPKLLLMLQLKLLKIAA